MKSTTERFEFDYFGSRIIYGGGEIARLEQFLAENELTDALLVCGPNVASNQELMRLVQKGLGNRLSGVFDGTTTEKTLDSVYQGIKVMHEIEADVLIGLGGGSSLDTARQIGVMAADNRDRSEFRAAAERGKVEPINPSENPTSVVVIPTTLAGAGISDSGSIKVLSAAESSMNQPIRVSGANMPIAMVYDPELFATTPTDLLSASAMNGFDKAIETVYAESANPVTDATALHSLWLFRESLPHLNSGASGALNRAVLGLILAQFQRRISIIHAFGHGLSRRYPVHQGNVHAVVAPHILEYIFGKIDAHRGLLARGLSIDTLSTSDTEIADRIVDTVIEIRNALGLPTRLQDLSPVDSDDFPLIAQFIINDNLMLNIPTELDPTPKEIETILHRAW